MHSPLSFCFGLLIWVGVMWDGFATIVLPRTVAPMRRLSGRFYTGSWRFWAAIGRRIRGPELRLSFLAIYGPISVMLLLVFLGLIITYMPLLDQAYASREVGSLLFGSRAGSPPSAIRLLRRYAATDHSEILRSNLRDGERWMADILQSHLSHPVLCFYRAQHFGRSWLVSLTTLLDACSLVIVGGEGLPREQARLTYRMGLLVLADLTSALGLSVPAQVDTRLTEADLPALRAALSSAGITLRLGPTEATELLRINHRYNVYLHALSQWLMISLPAWIPPAEEPSKAQGLENTQAWNPVVP